MRLAGAALPPSLFRRAAFLFLPLHHARTLISLSLRPNQHPAHKPPRRRPMTSPSPSRLSTAAPSPPPPAAAPSLRSTKKARREAPENILRHRLDQCSKRGDLPEALRLYDAARADNLPLSVHQFNVLLYLCSSDPVLGLERGFEISRHMSEASIAPNEATFTSLARLAATKQDPALAFDLVKQMAAAGIPPRLRSYGPALFGFCSSGDTTKAREVESHMDAAKVVPEEPEIAALLQAHAGAEQSDQVYRLLHRMRGAARQVLESTAEIVEGWFRSEAAAAVGVEEWDVGKVKEGVVKGGGGWHGQGWLGKGKWNVGRSEMDANGVCRRCGEKLVSIDIDPRETEDFAKSLAALAYQRQAKDEFKSFQEWLDRHGPFDAVIDGANVGLYNQRDFSFNQLRTVVNGIRELSPSKKLPLVVLHSRRVRSGPAESPNNKKLLESWQRSGALYSTPPGSNDDWYWLYAAVRCRSLLVTNDEMRDHLFELLGTSFFPRWKEKHQVRLTFTKPGTSFHMPPPYSTVIQVRLTFTKPGTSFHMPPPYSTVIQESEGGSWHVPTVTGNDIETPRQWVCATRDATVASSLSPAQLGEMKL